jgi:hypothetical protein
MLVRFTQTQLDYVVNLLARQPYGEVAQLLGEIGTQVRQEQATDAAASGQVVPMHSARAAKRSPGRPRKPRVNGAAEPSSTEPPAS